MLRQPQLVARVLGHRWGTDVTGVISSAIRALACTLSVSARLEQFQHLRDSRYTCNVGFEEVQLAELLRGCVYISCRSCPCVHVNVHALTSFAGRSVQRVHDLFRYRKLSFICICDCSADGCLARLSQREGSMKCFSFLLALSLLALCSTVDSRFVVEQGGIKVKFPASARSNYPKGFDTSLANFGE